MRDPIRILAADGQTLATLPRSNAKRFSMAAAADHRTMDAFAAKDPRAAGAQIGGMRFIFRNGRSMLAPGQI